MYCLWVELLVYIFGIFSIVELSRFDFEVNNEWELY